MDDVLKQLSVRVKNYKCFGDKEQGFDRILPINVIVGRNNSGKSTLLELIRYTTQAYPEFADLGHGNASPEVFLTQPLQENELLAVFPKETRGGTIPAPTHWAYGQKWVGKPITYRLETARSGSGKVVANHVFVKVDPPFAHRDPEPYEKRLANATKNPLEAKPFKSLLAERDVRPEPVNTNTELNDNGSGATNIIQQYINSKDLPSDLIEKSLLDELNSIYMPDSTFSRILVQHLHNTVWEVYLEEPEKGRIPLTHTGSGFKTVLLVLIMLHIVPHFEKKRVGEYVFAFEELENNLHPALQRRLLSYLRTFALKHGCTIFLTTHSNVVIDMFSRDKEAQIVHVTHDGQEAGVTSVKTYIEKGAILDDLDVRASDLLQSNCVVWVEGPSDRLYFNRWIELWTDGELKEGTHYQCMYYGGRLLAHLSADDPEHDAGDGIALLRLNRNAIMLMDSDKKKSADDINATKSRIVAEVNGMGGISWVTQGREVENYIPSKAFTQICGKPDVRLLGQFEDLAAYLDENVGVGEGDRFERRKPEFAARVRQALTKDGLSETFDLSDRLNEVCAKIREWNKVGKDGSH
jgi:putative ATP-dependent endonuclease of the OLD family